MLRLNLLRLGLVVLALVGARPVLADPITFTGFVENDFSASNPNVQITPVSNVPNSIGVSSFITQNGWVSGWAIKDIRTDYNAATDTLYVGLDTFKNAQGVQSIVGDADGNGNPGGASPQMTALHGVDNPNLGGYKSVAIGFAPNGTTPAVPGNVVAVAGVPADKTEAGTGIDGFNVAAYKGNNLGLAYNFGSTLTNNLGVLAFNPSAQHPGFEFTIKNFSKIPGLNPQNGFWITAYAGSPNDVVAGEMSLPLTHVAVLGQQTIPEPATLLAWSLVAGVAALRVRARRPRQTDGQPCA